MSETRAVFCLHCHSQIHDSQRSCVCDRCGHLAHGACCDVGMCSKAPMTGKLVINPVTLNPFKLPETAGEEMDGFVFAKPDPVNHPSHYNTGKIEVIEFIEDQKLGFNLGNAVKYVARAGKKDPAKLEQDLQKAIWYIRRELELTKENPRRPNEMTES